MIIDFFIEEDFAYPISAEIMTRYVTYDTRLMAGSNIRILSKPFGVSAGGDKAPVILAKNVLVSKKSPIFIDDNQLIYDGSKHTKPRWFAKSHGFHTWSAFIQWVSSTYDIPFRGVVYAMKYNGDD